MANLHLRVGLFIKMDLPIAGKEELIGTVVSHPSCEDQLVDVHPKCGTTGTAT